MLADFFLPRIPQARLRLRSSHLNWERLIHQAAEEGVLPSLNRQVAAHKLSAAVPPEIQDLFITVESLNGERNKQILAEAVHVALLLNQIGIRPVALKGLAYLLTVTYPNPAARYLLDIDLLLPEHQIPKAFAHLLQNQYFLAEPDAPLNLRHHHPAIRRDGSPSLEFHHQVTLGSDNRLLPVPAILAAAQPLECQGAHFLIPSATHLVNHLVLHSQLQHPYQQRVFPPLRALLDLIHLQNRFPHEIDWHALAKTYRDHGHSHTLILHLHQAHQLLGFPIPPPIPATLTLPLQLRFNRRQILNRHPKLRLIDPHYLLMSLFSRRLRLLPLILKDPTAWPRLLLHATRPAFYRNLIS